MRFIDEDQSNETDQNYDRMTPDTDYAGQPVQKSQVERILFQIMNQKSPELVAYDNRNNVGINKMTA